MKKYLMLAASLLLTLGMQAIDYTGTIRVTVNDFPADDAEDQVVMLTKEEGGTYTFNLKNFILWQNGEPVIPVGNVHLTGLQIGATENGFRNFTYNDNIALENGDDQIELFGETIDMTQDGGLWAGPSLGLIPVQITSGSVNDTQLNVVININLEGMEVVVTLEASAPAAAYELSGSEELTTGNNTLEMAEDGLYTIEKNVHLTAGTYSYAVNSILADEPQSFTINDEDDYTIRFSFNTATGELKAVNPATNWPVALENTESVRQEKMLLDGKVYIKRNGHIFTATGQIVE